MLANSFNQPLTAIATFPTVSSLKVQSSPITVRHAESTDGDALHAIFHHPEVLYWTVDLPFAPTEVTHHHVLKAEDENYVLAACDGPIIVGVLRLSVYPSPRMRHAGRIGPVAVHPEHRGKGVGSVLMTAATDFADNWLNLSRLHLLVFVDNQAAIKLYKKAGFMDEGKLRQLVFRAGNYVDAIVMARLKEDHLNSCH